MRWQSHGRLWLGRLEYLFLSRVAFSCAVLHGRLSASTGRHLRKLPVLRSVCFHAHLHLELLGKLTSGKTSTRLHLLAIHYEPILTASPYEVRPTSLRPQPRQLVKVCLIDGTGLLLLQVSRVIESFTTLVARLLSTHVMAV